ALALPLLHFVQGGVAAAAAVCLVSLCYAFMLDPTTAELANAADRRGMSCYSAVFAAFNVAYGVCMVATDVAAPAAAARLGFVQVLLGFSVALIVVTPLLWRKGRSVVESREFGSERSARVVMRGRGALSGAGWPAHPSK